MRLEGQQFEHWAVTGLSLWCQLPNFSAKNVNLACACTHVSVFTMTECIYESCALFREKETSLCAIHFITTYIIQGIYKLFLE